jgi:glutamate-1-semialdehyde 2,1-aminomutase
VPQDTVRHTHIVPFNDLDAVRRKLEASAAEIAAVILEPVVGNMGCIPPREGFLRGLAELCERCGVMLVVDEVMTGFRVARGGAAERYGIRPDLVTLGKVIGGGLPVGAYGGRRDLMQQVSPVGPVYQAGTLSGNPLAMAAGIATLDALARRGVYETLENRSALLEAGLAAAARAAGVAARVQRVGSMLTLFFTAEPVTDYATAARCDTAAFGRFFQGMLSRGVYLPASQFEAWFVSLAHSDADIRKTVAAAGEAIKEVAR